jgi:hypothetical protein
MKIDFGVSITAFRDFFVKDHQAYSIVMIKEFKGKESQSCLKKFVKDNLKASNTFKEILILCSCFLNG